MWSEKAWLYAGLFCACKKQAVDNVLSVLFSEHKKTGQRAGFFLSGCDAYCMSGVSAGRTLCSIALNIFGLPATKVSVFAEFVSAKAIRYQAASFLQKQCACFDLALMQTQLEETIQTASRSVRQV